MPARIVLTALLLGLSLCAWSQNAAVAQYNRGVDYYNKKDYRNAAACFRKASEMGYAKAASLAGQAYYWSGDYSQAIAWLQKPAEKGDAEAQLTLGYAYDELKNYLKALPWFRKAADRGEAYAQFKLGLYYFEGHGVKKNYSEAERWYRNVLRNPKGMSSANNIAIMKGHLEEIGLLHAPGQILGCPPGGSSRMFLLQASFYPDESIRFRADGKTIIIDNLPANGRWKHVMLSLASATDQDFNQSIYSGQKVVRYPIEHLPDGYYFLSVYISHDEKATFSSYVWGRNIALCKNRSGVSFHQSPVFNHNNKIYLSNRTDRRALEFYLQPTIELPASDPNIIALTNKITRGAGNDYGKAKAIHDWVCNNIWYDWDSFRSGNLAATSAIETINSRKSVCEGYALVAATLLRAAGIPARIVTGYALGVSNNNSGWSEADVAATEPNHAWNEAFVGGDWIIIDTTWDSSNKFQNGQFSTGTGLKYYRYFDATVEMFSMDHKIFESREMID